MSRSISFRWIERDVIRYGSASMDFGTTLIFSILFGSIGMGYFVYGKKQQAALPLLAGIVLCIFPYFVSNVYIMVLVGIILTVLPWVI
jgi:hypothetical protein